MPAVIYIHITYTQRAPSSHSFNDIYKKNLTLKMPSKRRLQCCFCCCCALAKFNIMCPRIVRLRIASSSSDVVFVAFMTAHQNSHVNLCPFINSAQRRGHRQPASQSVICIGRASAYATKFIIFFWEGFGIFIIEVVDLNDGNWAEIDWYLCICSLTHQWSNQA